MTFSYMIQFADKQTLAQTSIMGLVKDLVCFYLYRRPSGLSRDPTKLSTAETCWKPICMGRVHLLFRLFCCDLSSLTAHGTIPHRQISCSQLVSFRAPNSATILNHLHLHSLVWGVLLACHAAVHNFTGLLVLRFLLGVAESSITPGFTLVTGMWYSREEQPLRYGIWFTGNFCAVMFSNLFAYGISHIKHGLPAWKVKSVSSYSSFLLAN